MDIQEYVDIDISFEPINGDLLLLSKNESIVQSIMMIVLTEKGEIESLPEFGSNINDLMFENIHSALHLPIIKMDIEEDISKWEPRIELQSVNIFDEDNGRKLIVEVLFSTRDFPENLNKLLINIRKKLL